MSKLQLCINCGILLKLENNFLCSSVSKSILDKRILTRSFFLARASFWQGCSNIFSFPCQKEALAKRNNLVKRKVLAKRTTLSKGFTAPLPKGFTAPLPKGFTAPLPKGSRALAKRAKDPCQKGQGPLRKGS